MKTILMSDDYNKIYENNVTYQRAFFWSENDVEWMPAIINITNSTFYYGYVGESIDTDVNEFIPIDIDDIFTVFNPSLFNAIIRSNTCDYESVKDLGSFDVYGKLSNKTVLFIDNMNTILGYVKYTNKLVG